MTPKPPNLSNRNVPKDENTSRLLDVAKRFVGWDGFLAILWIVNIASLVPRQYLVLQYQTMAGLPPWMEPLAAPLGWIGLWAILASCWWLRIQVLREQPSANNRAHLWIVLSLLPLALNLLRSIWPTQIIGPSLFEPLWTAFWTGLGVSSLWPTYDAKRTDGIRITLRFHYFVVVVSCLSAFGWWWYQAHTYHANYLLGFNDYGHFTQRIASTVNGDGWLRESPVLPMFWDHFNPGLLFVVPLWWLFPTVETIFALQAFCFAISGLLIGRIVLALGGGRGMAALWTVIWLLHPNISQMNLAYTYGWHPITLAIPWLLFAALKTIRQQHSQGLWGAIVACSMEETVIVIVGACCIARALGITLQTRFPNSPWHCGTWENRLGGQWKGGTWLWGGVLALVAFLIVYRWSGLAEFQTARFARLGNTPWEILASPVLRPQAFWGQLFQFRSAAFLACLAIPLLPLMAWRTWTIWLGTLLPLGVLMVWDHTPAKSIAFQYPSTILPVWFVAAIVGALEYRQGKWRWGLSWGALVASLLLSVHIGQMPWSSPSLTDVESITYGPEGMHSRDATSAAGRWLTIQTDEIRASREPVLATGRVASHLIGCREVETVGQLEQRREALTKLTPDASPLLRYRVLILDRSEQFQQSPASTLAIEKEAMQLGFRKRAEEHNIAVYFHPE